MQSHQHKFLPSNIHEGYEVCECGTFHSIAQGDPKEIYVEKKYWAHENHHSTWDEQIQNLTSEEECGISKINKILNYIPQRKPVLEIACSPGIMMKALRENGYEVVGIEPNHIYNNDLFHQNPYAQIINGFFPTCTKGLPPKYFDYIIGMDIFEHVDDYEAFIFEIYRLLEDGGKAFLMSPIILNDGQFRERDFLPYEHCWIHSQAGLELFLKRFFKEVEFTRWIVGHEVIILTK